jgi:hypothetical protein
MDDRGREFLSGDRAGQGAGQRDECEDEDGQDGSPRMCHVERPPLCPR